LISDHLDPEEVVERLGLTSEQICELLEDMILDSLDQFEDVYNESDFLDEDIDEGC